MAVDPMVVAILVILCTNGFFVGLPPVVIDAEVVGVSSRAWVAPILTLLGMVCATTAFIFSVVERAEFALIRKIGVENQLWSVFSEIIFWLAVSAVSAAILSFIPYEQMPELAKVFALFLFGIVSLCLLKFAWVMRQIISVRASR